MTTPPADQPPQRRSWGWMFWVFTPLLAALALHWWLKARAEAFAPAFALEDVPALTNWLAILWILLRPLLAVVAGIALLVWLRRRLGWARLVRPLVVLWWLLFAAFAWKTWSAHTDRAQLQPAPAVQAEVLGVAEQAPSERGVGGVVVFMQSPAWPGPRRALLEGAPPGSVAPGSKLALNMARGAHGGDYVTAWSLAAAAPASAAPPAAP